MPTASPDRGWIGGQLGERPVDERGSALVGGEVGRQRVRPRPRSGRAGSGSGSRAAGRPRGPSRSRAARRAGRRSSAVGADATIARRLADRGHVAGERHGSTAARRSGPGQCRAAAAGHATRRGDADGGDERRRRHGPADRGVGSPTAAVDRAGGRRSRWCVPGPRRASGPARGTGRCRGTSASLARRRRSAMSAEPSSSPVTTVSSRSMTSSASVRPLRMLPALSPVNEVPVDLPRFGRPASGHPAGAAR